MKLTTIVLSAIIGNFQILCVSAGSQVVGRQATPTLGVQVPSARPLPGASRSQGCFTSSANMTSHSIEFPSSGSCQLECQGKDFWVMALHGADCLCGFVYPPRDSRTDDEDCNYPCPGFDKEACGSIDPNAFSVFNTGIRVDVSYAEAEESSSTRPAATSTSSAPTSAAATQTTASSVPTDGPEGSEGSNQDGDEDSGPNVAAIAAGVVGGLAAVAAVAGGFWFYMRRKRNAEIEEEHRRNAAVNAFISGAKPPSSSGISITDSRLEPGFATRRLSDGSIADNQDYSRKILRVR
ncbi:hypothetical protein S7711_04262 [Stachybotrys chartarum IBT 7711]|uniref:WSC domain-containing protein n=1 Tax=Stachybotrys chartarum (strain CBS 109288 / IBT 7711) TaxID=1280523 RepID=A0A084AJ85_STACB|nr:hypothetical protein S7711_04262 [Stachybotrys chartarum IBT 7711]KFA51129.1 hypothetical protein S40293_04728 [Stachybotrys chartarum IBT 40293]KFA79063.1 hypothetical protein S40288_08153 [Stachybotrys chartarum IBT 40288]